MSLRAISLHELAAESATDAEQANPYGSVSASSPIALIIVALQA